MLWDGLRFRDEGSSRTPWLRTVSVLQAPIPGLVGGTAKRKQTLSPEELEDRRIKRQAAAAKRKRLTEEKRRRKEEAEHEKKYVCYSLDRAAEGHGRLGGRHRLAGPCWTALQSHRKHL